jgi:DNA-binding transcriptional regulator YiaG
MAENVLEIFHEVGDNLDMATTTQERARKGRQIVYRKSDSGKTHSVLPAITKEQELLIQLRSALKWSRVQLARVLNCSDRAIVNWEQGEAVSGVYSSKLRELQTVYDELKELMKPEEVGRWLATEMEEFDGHSPADLIRRGDTGRLWRSLFYLRTGAPD